MKGLPAYHLCANGTYSDIEGLSDCKICDAGFRCPSVGMEAPEECPNGTYSYSDGARYCVLCPEGHRWGYHLIINLIWVLVHIGHRHHMIIQQFIHSWFHSLIQLAAWYRDTSHVTWLSKEAIHTFCFSCTPQRQACHISSWFSSDLSMWYISCIAIKQLEASCSCHRYKLIV